VEDSESDPFALRSHGAQVRLDAARIQDYVESVPETYAGHWLDSEDSWVIAFTDDVERHRVEIVKVMNSADNVTVVQFQFSYRHLLMLRDRIVEILGTKEGLTSWGPDVRHNCVLVQVRPEQLDEVRRTFSITNPDDVRVEPGPPVIPA
jgi:hypothetical protein